MASSSHFNLPSDSNHLVEAIENPDHVKFQEIREQYYDILERLKLLSDGAGDGGCTTEDLTVHVGHLNEVFEKVKRADEARIDAKVLKQVGVLGKANIEKTQSSLLTFKPSEYADNLISFMDNGESITEIFEPDSVSLKNLSEAMSYLYRSTYGFEPLFGALEWNPPQSKGHPRKRQESRTTVQTNVIKRVEDATTNEENQVEEVSRIFSVLKRRYQEGNNRPIDFLEFVIDPKCFSTTVQNLFHTSFLIRDNLIDVTFDEHKIPHLSPIRKRDAEAKRNSSRHQNKQSVIEMNTALWEEMIKVIGIEEAMIPNVRQNAKRPLLTT